MGAGVAEWGRGRRSHVLEYNRPDEHTDKQTDRIGETMQQSRASDATDGRYRGVKGIHGREEEEENQR